MNPYYMTAETRQALIAESNRLIAARRKRSAATDSEWADSQGDIETSPAGLDSKFARLVSDLQSTSVLATPPALRG